MSFLLLQLAELFLFIFIIAWQLTVIEKHNELLYNRKVIPASWERRIFIFVDF